MLKDVLHWWWETAQPLVRHRAAPSAGRPRIVVRRDRLDLLGDGAPESFALDDAAAMSRLAAHVRTMKSSPAVDLEPSRFVIRRLSPVRLPLSRARTMASLDLAASTPFKADEVLALQVRGAAPTSLKSTAYVIVKRSVLRPVLEMLRSAGRPVAEIGLLAARDGRTRDWIVAPDETQALTAAPKVSGKPLRIAAATLALVLVGTFLHAHWRLSAAQARAEEQLPALETAARKVRNELNQRSSRIAEITALRQSLVTQRSMSELLEELSRVLPDSAYLTNLAVREGTATLVGFSRSASALIAPIETSPMFEGAEFISPVTKAAGRDDERFEIRMNIVNR